MAANQVVSKSIALKYENLNCDNERKILEKEQQDLAVEIQSLEEKVKNYEKTLDEISEIRSQISALHSNKTDLFKKIAKSIDSDMNSYQMKFFNLEEKLAEELRAKEQEQKVACEETTDRVNKQIAAKDEMLKELQRQIDYLLIQVKGNQKNLEKCELERAEFSNRHYDSESEITRLVRLQTELDRVKERNRLVDIELGLVGDGKSDLVKSELQSTVRIKQEARGLNFTVS